MINPIGEYTTRQYNILLACALKTRGLSGNLGTAAAIINQIDYWIEHNKNDDISNGKKDHYKDGKWWVYNTMSQWQEQFPYEAQKTIERTLHKLEKCGIVETGRYNQKGYDRTKWYTLNYKLIESLMQQEKDKVSLSNITKMSKSKGTNCPDALGQIDRSNTIEYTKNSTDNSHKAEKRKRELNRNTFNQGLESEYSTINFKELETLLLDN